MEEVTKRLAQAGRVFVITGAGMSADSGLPTYRGLGGLYEDGRLIQGMPVEEALSGEILKSRPELPWECLMQIEKVCRHKKPHRGHLLLAQLEEQAQVTVLTQNVDRFHQQAGSSDVIEIHGNLYDLRCMACHRGSQVENYERLAALPRCEQCGGILRPEVVLFGEMLPSEALGRLSKAMTQPWDVVLAIGTSAQFPYIIQPMIQAKTRGIYTVEINPQATELSRLADHHLAMGAEEALVRLLGA